MEIGWQWQLNCQAWGLPGFGGLSDPEELDEDAVVKEAMMPALVRSLIRRKLASETPAPRVHLTPSAGWSTRHPARTFLGMSCLSCSSASLHFSFRGNAYFLYHYSKASTIRSPHLGSTLLGSYQFSAQTTLWGILNSGS